MTNDVDHIDYIDHQSTPISHTELSLSTEAKLNPWASDVAAITWADAILNHDNDDDKKKKHSASIILMEAERLQ
jgi:hypothetical protein